MYYTETEEKNGINIPLLAIQVKSYLHRSFALYQYSIIIISGKQYPLAIKKINTIIIEHRWLVKFKFNCCDATIPNIFNDYNPILFFNLLKLFYLDRCFQNLILKLQLHLKMCVNIKPLVCCSFLIDIHTKFNVGSV